MRKGFFVARDSLVRANKGKNDEFYTQYEYIEKECENYRDQFYGKIIYCNCDDPEGSYFYQYFANNFNFFGLKKLITTHYDEEKTTYKLELFKDINDDGFIDSRDCIKTPLNGNGDFRNQESIDLLKEADIVVTNPPFSLFREYIAQLIKYDKKFLILGNMNAITYKEVFKLIKENKVWAGYGFNQSMVFMSPYKNNLEANRKFCEGKGYIGDNYIKTPAINWYTNLETKKHTREIILYKKYTPQEFPKYDNCDGIEVSKVADIPKDYDGIMGVPITFLDKYNPNQFKIVRFRKGDDGKDVTINGKSPYFRILIKNKKVEK
jgi:modification methylase ecoRI